MVLDDNWYERPDVEKFIEVLEDLGYEWDIEDLAGKPTLRIWKAAFRKRILDDNQLRSFR